MIANAVLETDGAIITSVNCCSVIFIAVSSSNSRLNAIIPPNAEVGSVWNANSYACNGESAIATPQGLACLTITQAGSVKHFTHSRAASVSAMLL